MATSKALAELATGESKVQTKTIRVILSVFMGMAAIPVLVIGRFLFNRMPLEVQP